MTRIAFSAFLVMALVPPAWAGSMASAAPKVLAYEADPARPAQNALEIPAETPILARLVTEVDIKKCKIGDRVEAQLTHDVKVNKQTVLKRGAHIVGQITKLQTTPDASGMYRIGILFSSVEQKNAAPAELHLDVQAVAPPPTEGPDDARDPRGMAQTNIDAGARGGLSGAEGPQGILTEKSRGPIRLPGLELGTEIAGGVHTTILASSKENIRLVKDSQIVFSVVRP